MISALLHYFGGNDTPGADYTCLRLHRELWGVTFYKFTFSVDGLNAVYSRAHTVYKAVSKLIVKSH